jgi:preprotein translocase subunit SecE
MYTALIIWVVVIGAAFGLAWYLGYWARLRDYCLATQEELKKCTWPTWAELKGSTVVIMISMIILGVFTFVVDLVFASLMRLVS